MNDQDHNAEIEQLRSWIAADRAEIARLKHNEAVMMDALYKACADDEEMVRQIIESQGVLRCATELLKG